jgi:type I restriction enzyme, R subunit
MITESELEAQAITWFQDTGWEFRHGPDIATDGDTREPRGLPPSVIDDTPARRFSQAESGNTGKHTRGCSSTHCPAGSSVAAVQQPVIYDALLNGLPVEIEIAGEKRGDRVRLVDFERPERNRILLVNQFAIQGIKQPRRPDLLVFVNGLPIAVIELKNLISEQTDIWSAFNQLQTYKEEIPDLFGFNEALVISDGLHARVGSLSSDRERFLPWRTIRDQDDRPLLEFELEKVVRGFFAPDLLLDYLRYFVLFEDTDTGTVKNRRISPVPRRP